MLFSERHETAALSPKLRVRHRPAALGEVVAGTMAGHLGGAEGQGQPEAARGSVFRV
jgi:hypothetical protein